MTWFRIAFQDALTHCVHRSLFTSLAIDMAERQHAIEDFEQRYGREFAASFNGNPAPISEWAFDLGGGCYTTMPRETIEVDGLSIVVDCDHFEVVLRAVEDSKIRRFADGAWYYKLKFWLHATVLTVEHHDAIEAVMQAKAASAKSRAAGFFAQRDARRAQ